MNNASPVYLKGKLVDIAVIFHATIVKIPIYQQKDIKVEYH